MPLKVDTNSKQSRNPKGKRKSGFFNKLKKVFSPNASSSSSIASRSRTREDDGESLGTIATRTRSRMSVFGSYRENKEALEAERQSEERKSKCLAIKAAKRDPPAVQRLLVDCEFCNPPPKFGREISIESPGFTSKETEDSLKAMKSLQESHADLSNERDWNAGLDAWTRMREWWLTPTVDEQPIHHLDSDLTQDRYYTVYDKMIYQTRPLKHPLNLSDMIKIVKAGWVGEGSWPQLSDNDVWSTTDAEELANSKTSEANGTAATTLQPASTNSGSAGEPTPNDSKISLATHNQMNDNAKDESKPQGRPRIHVQFSDRPHPREKSPHQGLNDMPSLERVQSSIGTPIRPIRSAQSSVVSITDSD